METNLTLGARLLLDAELSLTVRLSLDRGQPLPVTRKNTEM